MRQRTPFLSIIIVMIANKKDIQALQFRSNLPRLYDQNTYLFAFFEPAEQKLSPSEKYSILSQEYINLVTTTGIDPDISLTYIGFRELPGTTEDFTDIELAFSLSNGRYFCGKIKIYQNTFCYFADESLLRTHEKIDIADYER